eukprot:1693906-Amphidinium_carterae.2
MVPRHRARRWSSRVGMANWSTQLLANNSHERQLKSAKTSSRMSTSNPPAQHAGDFHHDRK